MYCYHNWNADSLFMNIPVFRIREVWRIWSSMNEEGKHLVAWSPVSRSKMQSYILTDYRLQKEETFDSPKLPPGGGGPSFLHPWYPTAGQWIKVSWGDNWWSQPVCDDTIITNWLTPPWRRLSLIVCLKVNRCQTVAVYTGQANWGPDNTRSLEEINNDLMLICLFVSLLNV